MDIERHFKEQERHDFCLNCGGDCHDCLSEPQKNIIYIHTPPFKISIIARILGWFWMLRYKMGLLPKDTFDFENEEEE